MSFWDKITGNDITREFKDFEGRVKNLPEDYQVAWENVKNNLWEHSDFTGRNLMPILEGVLELLEETSNNGQSVEMVLGTDIKEFCRELVSEDGANSYGDKWRKQLNNNISKRLGR